MRMFAVPLLLVLMTVAAQAENKPAPQASETLPPFIERGLRGPGHEAMDILAGDWRVQMELYIAGGAPGDPLTGELVSERKMIGNGRFLYDVTTGELSNGAKYWRTGTLGYSAIDNAYEWVTQDGVNANMMIYQGAPGSGPSFPVSLTGAFTDQGVLGEEYAGKNVRQRTHIEIKDDDRHLIDLYFTPPGENERLVGRMEYTRIED